MAIGAGAAAMAALGWRRRAAADQVPKRPQPGAPRPEDVKLPAGGKMPMRKLGSTGVEVSVLGLGGFHIGLPKDEKTAVEIVRAAIDHGVTFMDNCWDYNDGKSEVWMGHALRDGYRKRVVLMTKIDGRTRKSAAEQIDQSLRSFGTDVIDLVQIHEVIRMSDPDRVFGPDGAIEALVAARKAGKIRFIGFTGHKSPEIHLNMLAAAEKNKFKFDTVQMPVSVMDAHYDSFTNKVLPELTRKKIGALGMKPFGSGLFFKSAPLANRAITPAQCLQFAMGEPTSVVITGCDTMGVLMQGIDAAYRWRPMNEAERQALLAHTAPVAKAGEYEKYKTSGAFDGTDQHPWWMETASIKKV
jgi:aryl-alcohol dehydrogenase-like predicted oxidoreductase